MCEILLEASYRTDTTNKKHSKKQNIPKKTTRNQSNPKTTKKKLNTISTHFFLSNKSS